MACRKRSGILREPQHERKIITDFKPSPFVPSIKLRASSEPRRRTPRGFFGTLPARAFLCKATSSTLSAPGLKGASSLCPLITRGLYDVTILVSTEERNLS